MASKKRKIAVTSTATRPKRTRRDFAIVEEIGDGEIEKRSCPSIDNLPAEILATIVSFLPIEQWPIVESVSRRFQTGVISAWRNIRQIQLADLIFVPSLKKKTAYQRRQIRFSVLRMLNDRTPMVESIKEFSRCYQSMGALYFGRLVRFQHLKILNLSLCQVEVENLADFLTTSASRSTLEELDLSHCLHSLNAYHVDNDLRAAFADHPDRPPLCLKTFVYVEDVGLSRGGFLTGLNCSLLEKLEISNPKIRGQQIVRLLERCERLRELKLDLFGNGNMTLDDVAGALSSLPSTDLRKLHIADNADMPSSMGETDNFQGVINELGRRWPHLTDMDFSWNFGGGDYAIDAILEHYTDLETLDIDVADCDESALVRLVPQLHGLKRLGFSCGDDTFCPISSRVIQLILAHHKNLTMLRLYEPELTVEDAHQFKELTNLKELTLHGPFINSKVLVAVADAVGDHLEYLDVECERVTDAGMAVVVKKLLRIKCICLSGGPISNRTLRAIAKWMPDLRKLVFLACFKITRRGLQSVIDGCPRLDHLSLCLCSVGPEHVDQLVYTRRLRVLVR